MSEDIPLTSQVFMVTSLNTSVAKDLSNTFVVHKMSSSGLMDVETGGDSSYDQ